MSESRVVGESSLTQIDDDLIGDIAALARYEPVGDEVTETLRCLFVLVAPDQLLTCVSVAPAAYSCIDVLATSL